MIWYAAGYSICVTLEIEVIVLAAKIGHPHLNSGYVILLSQ